MSERGRDGGRARRPEAVVGGSRERRAQLRSGARGRACALRRRSRVCRGGPGGVEKAKREEWEVGGGARRPSLPPSRGAAAAALPPPLRRHFGFAWRRGRRFPVSVAGPTSPQFLRLKPHAFLFSSLAFPPVRAPAGRLLTSERDPPRTEGSGGAWWRPSPLPHFPALSSLGLGL